jgi:hypothetical protein
MSKSVSLQYLTPVKAIRAHCLECSGHVPSEVRLCQLSNCKLWPYRMGKRPKRLQTATAGGVEPILPATARKPLS